MSKPRPSALDRKITELELAVEHATKLHQETHAHYRQQLEAKNEQHYKEMEIEAQRRYAVEAHNLVLQSDRDRLTATVEALSRRLASPTAETDPSRGGWRSAQRLGRSSTPIEQLVAKSRDL